MAGLTFVDFAVARDADPEGLVDLQTERLGQKRAEL